MFVRNVTPRRVLPEGRKFARNYCLPVKTENAVEYPPILDTSFFPRRERQFQKTYVDAVKNITTVEEKIFKLNMPRYYGWKPVILTENYVPYNVLPSAQYITRTHVMPEKSLPTTYYDSIISSEAVDVLAKQLQNQFEEMLLFEFQERMRDREINPQDSIKPDVLENLVSNVLIRETNRFMLTNFSPEFPHLMETDVDFDPRVEAFWHIGGIPKNARRYKEFANHKTWKNHCALADKPDDRCMQFLGSAVVQLRHEFPLPEILPHEESENPDFKVPDYKYCPSFLGYSREPRRATIIPGFWPGEKNEFGLLSMHKRGHLCTRSPKYDDANEALITQAILASFGWLYSLACYQGFSTFNDVTYPLVHQSVITNGKLWSFFVYQLNTTAMYSDILPKNNKANLCWGTEPMQLFECIENGKMQGFNEDVLKHLIKFYANAPQKRNIEMQPYLGQPKTISDYEDSEKRIWLEQRYKYLMSNRPNPRPMRPFLLWQKFFMMDHKTRPLEKKREPWEFGERAWMRTLDDHRAEYVPKCLRGNPIGKKRKVGRLAKTFYPK